MVASMGRGARVFCALGFATLAGTAACSKGGSASDGAPAATSTAPAAVATGDKLLKCGDFLSRAEVTALGLDASHYDENDTQQSAGLNVLCKTGQVLTAISGGQAYESTRAGGEEAIKKGIIKKDEGPAVGSASTWTQMAPMSTLAFRSTSKKYAATISGRDKAIVEKVARALDAKMN
jgi:hypothetical protein